jgi:hypothetical protein
MAIKRDLLVDKLFNEKQYNTLYISKVDEENAQKEQVETMVELLCDDRHKASRQGVLNFIKKEPKALEILMRAIIEATSDKKTLVAACWEGNIECTPFLTFFATLVVKENFEVAMEALTVIEHMTGEVKPELAKKLIEEVKAQYKPQAETSKAALLLDLVQLLHRWEV